MIILAIDPGTTSSAWLIFNALAGQPSPSLRGIEPNGNLLERLRGWHDEARVGEVPFLNALVIERVASYGMSVGDEVFETVHWAGRFAEAAYPIPVFRLVRKDVTLNLCQSARANDSNVRRALLDRFGGDAAIGRKASPGPLHGIHGDLWAALGVAVTFADMPSPEQEAAWLR